MALLLGIAVLSPFANAVSASGGNRTNANDPVWIFAQSLPTGIDRAEVDLNTISDIDGVDERVDVDIAILDTGVNMNHPDLNVVGGTSCVSSEPTPEDGHGHGTHVAGTAAALDNGIGVVGVAPGARIWAVKVLSSFGSGTFQQVACGVDWVTARAGQIDVISMSLGGSGFDDGNCGFTNGDVLHQAICRAVDKGIVVVVAAGNSASDAQSFIPAAYDEVITVSAIADFDGAYGAAGSPTCRVDQDDTLADFSNYGADVDIAGPGVCIYSTYKSGGYTTFSGTSMATPHVSGAAGIAVFLDGKPTDKAGTVAIKDHLVRLGAAQGSLKGFTGDRDSIPEPLLIVEDLEGPPPPPAPSPLQVEFTWSPPSPVVLEEVSFTSDVVGGVPPYTYLWNFGDGEISDLPNPTHTYLFSGRYTVVLRVQDSGGNTATVQHDVWVSLPTPPATFKADFTWDPEFPIAGEKVSFTSKVTGGKRPYDYTWSFGDGDTSKQHHPKHTYEFSGRYTVLLVVVDSSGNVANVQHEVCVSLP